MVSRLKSLDSKGANENKSDRFGQELSDEFSLARIGFDTAENESSKVSYSVVRLS